MKALKSLQLQLDAWNVELDSARLTLLSRYATLLSEYELANVIGTRNHEQILLEHVTDSLSCLLALDPRRPASVVDVGTGAGLPGIPLAIARSEYQVTLVEATQKKARFLDYALTELNLENLEMVNARVEDMSRSAGYREVFDVATARALATLPVVAEYCAPLVTVGGRILAMKARISEEELSQGVTASADLRLKLHEIIDVRFSPQFPQKERKLLVLRKIAATPKNFPRRKGLATKRPLGT